MNKAKCFRDLHISIPTHHKKKLFSVASNHGRLFVLEQLVLSEDEYRENIKKDKDHEVQEAKRWKMSLEEYRMQRNWIEESTKNRKEVDPCEEGKYFVCSGTCISLFCLFCYMHIPSSTCSASGLEACLATMYAKY